MHLNAKGLDDPFPKPVDAAGIARQQNSKSSQSSVTEFGISKMVCTVSWVLYVIYRRQKQKQHPATRSTLRALYNAKAMV